MFGTIESPSLRGEPLGCVAAEEAEEEDDKVTRKSGTGLCCPDANQKNILDHLEFFLQTVHLGPQGVNNVLSMFKHELLQLLRSLHQLNVLQNKAKQKTRSPKLLNKETILAGKNRSQTEKTDEFLSKCSDKTYSQFVCRCIKHKIETIAQHNLHLRFGQCLASPDTTVSPLGRQNRLLL